MILDPRTSRINFTPSIVDLTQMVSSVSRSLLESSKNMRRITVGIDPPDTARRGTANEDEDDHSFFSVISKEDEIIKSFVSIMEGISSVAAEIGKLMSDFDSKYKQIWDMDKEQFVQRMSHSKQGLESFDKHITRYALCHSFTFTLTLSMNLTLSLTLTLSLWFRYKEIEEDILHEESTYNVKFISVDCCDLKKLLVGHCREWQSKLTNLLQKKAETELNDILKFFSLNLVKMQAVPQNLEALGHQIQLNADLAEQSEAIPLRFGPLQKMLMTLEKFDVEITEIALGDDVHVDLGMLPNLQVLSTGSL